MPLGVFISLGIMGDVCLWVASLETLTNGKVSEPLAVGLGGNPVSWVEWQDIPRCVSAVVPIMIRFCLLGFLHMGRVVSDDLTSLPFLSWEAPSIAMSSAKQSNPSFAPLTCCLVLPAMCSVVECGWSLSLSFRFLWWILLDCCCFSVWYVFEICFSVC